MATNPKPKTTRAAAAVEKMLSGGQQRKVAVTLTGRAAEQWAHLAEKARALGLADDGLLAGLLDLSYATLADEMDRRSKLAAATEATARG